MNIQGITNNLFIFANNASKAAHYFRIAQDSRGNLHLKTNNLVLRLFYSFKKSHQGKITSLINRQVETARNLEKRCYYNEVGETTGLFNAAQRYNQTIKNQTSSLAKAVHQIEHPNVPGITPSTIRETLPKANLNPALKIDKPEKYKQRRFLKNHTIQRYPGDIWDHGKEAAHIFSSTQKERLLSTIGGICEKIGKLFGCKVKTFEKYHYNIHQETESQIYHTDSPTLSRGIKDPQSLEPTSYWLGHATLLLNIPLQSKNKEHVASFNVITDPVEGDLNALLYPRQTKFAHSMEKIPAPHVYVLSHNHFDHYSKKTIQTLLSSQPIMIVPTGDGERFKNLGFQNVKELNWWDTQEICFQQGDQEYLMNIVATPARHWAGQGPCEGHESTFLGYIIQGNPQGDLYFAGDTARLNDDHITKLRTYYPNIKWSFQPGGPDEVRKDMESTHQASVDGLWTHSELLLKSLYKRDMSKRDFIKEASTFATIFMHTMTFKLGNLHLSDTRDSISKVLNALEKNEVDGLKNYEEQVYKELSDLLQILIFKDDEKLTNDELATLLRKTVIIPKIGSRIGLNTSKSNQNEKLYDNFMVDSL